MERETRLLVGRIRHLLGDLQRTRRRIYIAEHNALCRAGRFTQLGRQLRRDLHVFIHSHHKRIHRLIAVDAMRVLAERRFGNLVRIRSTGLRKADGAKGNRSAIAARRRDFQRHLSAVRAFRQRIFAVAHRLELKRIGERAPVALVIGNAIKRRAVDILRALDDQLARLHKTIVVRDDIRHRLRRIHILHAGERSAVRRVGRVHILITTSVRQRDLFRDGHIVRLKCRRIELMQTVFLRPRVIAEDGFNIRRCLDVLAIFILPLHHHRAAGICRLRDGEIQRILMRLITRRDAIAERRRIVQRNSLMHAHRKIGILIQLNLVAVFYNFAAEFLILFRRPEKRIARRRQVSAGRLIIRNIKVYFRTHRIHDHRGDFGGDIIKSVGQRTKIGSLIISAAILCQSRKFLILMVKTNGEYYASILSKVIERSRTIFIIRLAIRKDHQNFF